MESSEEVERKMGGSLYEELDRIFHARTMAAVGVSDSMENMGMGFLLGYQKAGFKGKLYAINPNKKFKRFETFPSLRDVPGPVDFVQVCVPATKVPGVIEDCVKKGVLGASIFSSGFAESGTKEGAALQEEIVRIRKGSRLRVIGPNCMGIYCVESGMSIRSDMPMLADGKIGLISQSGGVSISVIMAAAERGIGFSKGVSYGNESDLGPPELLHYLSRDPKTEVICLYIEGTRRPDELRAALTDAAARKPLVVLKGGVTSVGNRAVSSHTGAMAGAGEIWEALVRQAGAVMASDIDEMLDLAALYSLSTAPRGKRVCLLSVSGGFGVFAADQIMGAGFEMPELTEQTRAALSKNFDAPGTSTKNPVDLAAKFFQPQHFGELFSAFNNEPNIDAFIVIVAIEYLTFVNDKAEQWSGFMVKALQNGLKLLTKPVYVVFFHTAADALRLKHEKSFLAEGLPVFPDMKRCLVALKKTREAKKRERK
jgi:acyl-CoA synthetase (NDP forming)